MAVFAPEPALFVSIRDVEGRSEISFAPGGQGYWVARMVANLGVSVVLCAPLGGRSGHIVAALAELEGVQVQGAPTHRSTAVWISSGPDGEPANVVETHTPPLNRHELDELYGITVTAAIDARVAVLTGLSDPGVLPSDVYGRLTRDLRANGVTVLADVSADALLACAAEGVDVVKVSQDDLPPPGDGSGPEDPAAAIARLHAAGAGRILLSRGEAPALAELDDRIVSLTAPSLTELNHRGAGDSMTGALAAGIATGLPYDEALRRAVAAGALNVTRHGLGTGNGEAIAALARHVEIAPAGGAEGRG